MKPSLPRRLRLDWHRGLGALRQAACRRHEREIRRRFREFHAALPDRKGAVYMFFTGGLLHWTARALSFVPKDVNLVLIGSALPEDEGAWLRERTPWPLHVIGPRVDDNTVLELLFETANDDFGWLHIDCFVLEPGLFAEMATLGDDVSINCIWSHPGGDGMGGTVHSAFVCFNHRVLQAVREAGAQPMPTAHHYEGTSLGRTITDRPLYSRVPTRRQVELLRRVVPNGPDGLPSYPPGASYFQVLVLYQLLAQALGFRLNPVRPLVRDGSGSMEHYSDEIIHVNGVATYKRYRDVDGSLGQRVYPLLLQADWAMVEGLGKTAPSHYETLRDELEAELRRLGIPPESVQRNLTGFLQERGVASERSARILGVAPTEA